MHSPHPDVVFSGCDALPSRNHTSPPYHHKQGRRCTIITTRLVPPLPLPAPISSADRPGLNHPLFVTTSSCTTTATTTTSTKISTRTTTTASAATTTTTSTVVLLLLLLQLATWWSLASVHHLIKYRSSYDLAAARPGGLTPVDSRLHVRLENTGSAKDSVRSSSLVWG